MSDTSVYIAIIANRVSSQAHPVCTGINSVGFFIGIKMICVKCRIDKPVTDFYKRNNKAGRYGICKICRRKDVKAYRLANIEKVKTYLIINTGKIKERKKAYRLRNLERMKKNEKAYRLANPEKIKAKNRKRRALKYGIGHKPYTDTYIFERDNWTCGICGERINRRLKYPNPKSKSIDHIIPLVKGGADAPVNLQATHLRCNMKKNTNSGGQLRLIG